MEDTNYVNAYSRWNGLERFAFSWISLIDVIGVKSHASVLIHLLLKVDL